MVLRRMTLLVALVSAAFIGCDDGDDDSGSGSGSNGGGISGLFGGGSSDSSGSDGSGDNGGGEAGDNGGGSGGGDLADVLGAGTPAPANAQNCATACQVIVACISQVCGLNIPATQDDLAECASECQGEASDEDIGAILAQQNNCSGFQSIRGEICGGFEDDGGSGGGDSGGGSSGGGGGGSCNTSVWCPVLECTVECGGGEECAQQCVQPCIQNLEACMGCEMETCGLGAGGF